MSCSIGKSKHVDLHNADSPIALFCGLKLEAAAASAIELWPSAAGGGALTVGALELRKNWGSHIDASHSRQPLVKGERVVRHEVNAVMISSAILCANASPMHALADASRQ